MIDKEIFVQIEILTRRVLALEKKLKQLEAQLASKA